MARQSREGEKQETAKGHTIPVPKRSDVLGDLRKVAKANDPDVEPVEDERDAYVENAQDDSGQSERG